VVTSAYRRSIVLSVWLLALVASEAVGQAWTPEQALEDFEKNVRPILVSRCQSCHGADKQKGGLRLDSREAALAGGDTGPAVVPGQPEESLLVEAINHGDVAKMPPKSKLPGGEVAVLTRWVSQGAHWPAQAGDNLVSRKSPAPGFDLQARARHWSFQPVRREPLPTPRRAGWVRTPIDAWILNTLENQGLAPAPETDRRTLLRRVTFDLVGLPPTLEEIEAFLADRSPSAYESVVDRLLASPRYGERWARHWLDLVRYAETSGHEFDYDILDAYRYRDYVVRALNDDLPYDQFVVEHLAGDLVKPYRRNRSEGFNESILGTGFFFLGEGTHSPLDTRDDEAARIDNQIDVLSKTFLGLTVACARCHDHKFDAITTRDYYALSGFLQSSRHQHVQIDDPASDQAVITRLTALKDAISQLFPKTSPVTDNQASVSPSALFEDFRTSGYENWFVSGAAFGAGPSRLGDFMVTTDQGESSVQAIEPGWAHSGLISSRLVGVLRSRTFSIESNYLDFLAYGQSGQINLVIDGFEKIRSPIYGGLTLKVDAADPRWYRMDVRMWKGQTAYLELADGGTVDYTKGKTAYNDGSGFLAVGEIRQSDEASLPPPAVARQARSLKGGEASRPRLDALLEQYRLEEAKLASPRFALAILDGTPEDQRVLIRGNTRTPGELVPRRFLEVFEPAGASSFARGIASERGSGRLELAQRMVDPANPLVARVLVNRLWKHHFGQGLVSTPDDFGVMGRPPTHPELLDELAARFVDSGWSIKAMHRLMVLSSTYRMSSRPDEAADEVDPTNQLLHRMNVRRLEAESIRDTILSVSGRLDTKLSGPAIPPHLTPFMEGRGRPAQSGPLDGDNRRSLYLNVRRNFPNSMLLAFDAPTPFSTMGKRNVSNVPAQALALLNDPFVLQQAKAWASRLLRAEEAKPSRRTILERAYLLAFGRPPNAIEHARGLAFLDALAPEGSSVAAEQEAWEEFCHVLMNVKEFIYVN